MSTEKSIKARAPYNSNTFNKNNNLLVGVNGVLSGGEVSTSGLTVTIQPMSFIQNGLIVKTGVLTATLSGTLQAPYYVAVTSSSPIENLAEVITPTFVKRPQDISANTVLVAEWDGLEWRPLPHLSPADMIRAQNQRAVAETLVGVASGLDVTKDASFIYVAPGAACTTDGGMVYKDLTTTFTKIPVDADGLGRIDEIVLRKPRDNPSRIATLQRIVGPTYHPTSGVLNVFSPVTASAVGPQAPLCFNSASSDDLYILVGEGNTPTVDLQFLTAPNATTAPTPVTTVKSGLDAYDAILNPDGQIDIVYTVGSDLYYQRISTAGVSIYAETLLHSDTDALTNPKIVSVASGSSYFLHVVFERYVSITHRQLCYVRRSAINTEETSIQVLVDLNATLKHPSLAKDDDDSTLFLAFENQDTGAAFLRTYDASTATATAAPTQIGLPVQLQDNTYDLSAMTLLPSTGAANPVVVRTQDKETFVFWRHDKGAGVYGIATYHQSYQTEFGYKALLRDLYAVSENVSEFAVAVDGLGTAHLTLLEAGLVGVANLRLAPYTVGATAQIVGSGATAVSALFNSRGSLVHGYGTASSSVLVKSAGDRVRTLRDVYLPPSDVYVAHYRTQDDVLSVSGTALEEDPSIRRLYEQNSLFAATGSVTWEGTPTNKLIINVALTIRAFDRSATYTIPANGPAGVTIPNGSAVYVILPDEDVSQNLTLNVLPFGQGTLDRHGRRMIPLFWAVSSVLYTKFAPFRLESGGETIILGDALTTEERGWLGLPATPDPNNHAYSSHNYLTDDMDYNTALGALDAAIGGGGGGGGGGPVTEVGIEIPSAGATSQVVKFDNLQTQLTYRAIAFFENSVDLAPQFQPITIVQKGLDGFVAKWNSPLDSGNYVLHYIVVDTGDSSGVTALGAGVSSTTVTFAGPRPNTNYRVIPVFENLVDASPQFQPVIVTDKTLTSFDAEWNSPTDSANYSLSWIVVASSLVSGTAVIVNGTASQSVTFSSPRIDTDYQVMAIMYNSVDATPQYQPITLTSKSVSGFTASWNAAADSANYNFDYFVYGLDTDSITKKQMASLTKLSGIYAAVVGSTAQVTYKTATHSDLIAALASVASGDTVLVLKSYTPTATPIAISTAVNLLGQGRATTICTGTVTVQADYCTLDNLRFGGNLTVSSNANHIRGWQATGLSITDTGLANALSVIQE